MKASDAAASAAISPDLYLVSAPNNQLMIAVNYPFTLANDLTVF